MYNNQTKIFGILGFPLSHTLSPLIHNTLLQKYNFNGIYLVFEKENPAKYLITGRDSIKIDGLSVTIPHKEWAYSIADETDSASSIMKASNTLIYRDEKIYAYNTDGFGAVRSIENYFPEFFTDTKSGDVLLLGSGGSARGISFALLQKLPENKKIYISARNKETSNSIINTLNSIRPGSSEFTSLAEAPALSKKIALIINTTPVGMKGKTQEELLPSQFFHADQFIFDIVYNPINTPITITATNQGAKMIPGYEMLLYQAMEQFALFTGIVPTTEDVNLIRSLLVEKLKI